MRRRSEKVSSRLMLQAELSTSFVLSRGVRKEARKEGNEHTGN